MKKLEKRRSIKDIILFCGVELTLLTLFAERVILQRVMNILGYKTSLIDVISLFCIAFWIMAFSYYLIYNKNIFERIKK